MGHWLWYFLTSTFGRVQLAKRLTVSATVKSLSASSLGEIEAPLPSPDDLERVASLVEASEEAFTSAVQAAVLRRETLRDGTVRSLRLNGDELR